MTDILGPSGLDGRTEIGAAELRAALGAVDRLPFPRYAGLADAIRDLVFEGRLTPGARLPAERELAATLGTSRVTVSAAYRQLREQGWATARHGSGTFTAAATNPARGWLPRAGSGWIELAHAAPAAPPELHPAYVRALARLPSMLSGHGYYADGLPDLRAAIAQRFTQRGLPTAADQILVTAGTGDATAVAFSALVRPGDRVLLEHPTYPGAVEHVVERGGRCITVVMDAADPDAWVAAAARAAAESAPRAAFLMPDFSNPSGAQLSPGARGRLAATLWRHGVVTIADEVSVELGLDEGTTQLPPYGAGLPDSATITVGGLSKAVWGGVRIGWLRSDAAVVAELGMSFGRRQLTVSALDQLVALELLAELDPILEGQRTRLRPQRQALLDALAQRLPQWQVRRPGGGLSLWCELPPELSSTAIVAAAGPRGLRLAPGTMFGTGHAFDQRLRLPYTRPVEELQAAVGILADVTEAIGSRSAIFATSSPTRVA